MLLGKGWTKILNKRQCRCIIYCTIYLTLRKLLPAFFTFGMLKLIPCLSHYVRATCLPHQVAVYCDSATFIRVATTTAMRLVHRDRPNDGEASANSSHIPFRHLEVRNTICWLFWRALATVARDVTWFVHKYQSCVFACAYLIWYIAYNVRRISYVREG